MAQQRGSGFSGGRHPLDAVPAAPEPAAVVLAETERPVGWLPGPGAVHPRHAGPVPGAAAGVLYRVVGDAEVVRRWLTAVAAHAVAGWSRSGPPTAPRSAPASQSQHCSYRYHITGSTRRRGSRRGCAATTGNVLAVTAEEGEPDGHDRVRLRERRLRL